MNSCIFNCIFLTIVLSIVPYETFKTFHTFNRPCKDTSPQCLKRSLQYVLPEFVNGIPEMGLTTLDPLVVNNLTFSLPGGIKINIKQGYSKGLRKCIVDIVRKLNGDKYEVKLHCDIVSKGKYVSSGRLLMFPIDGEGDSSIVCKNLMIRCTFKIAFVTRSDGNKYVQVENFKATHAFEGPVVYNMTNLFKENPKISKSLLNFMNENSHMVADEFGSPIIDFGIKSVLSNIKILLDAIPAKDLFD